MKIETCLKYWFCKQPKTQKSINFFINEVYSKAPKQNYKTNKTAFNHIKDIWILEILDLKDYGPENNRGHRKVLVVIDILCKLGWTVPLIKKLKQ